LLIRSGLLATESGVSPLPGFRQRADSVGRAGHVFDR